MIVVKKIKPLPWLKWIYLSLLWYHGISIRQDSILISSSFICTKFIFKSMLLESVIDPSHIPLHSIPQGHPSASAPSTLTCALNLGWWSVSHMIMCMFQCYSLKSSHPHLLPQSPKDCSLHVSLLLSLIQGHCCHLSKFHIYVLVYCIGVFLFDLLPSV